MNKSLQMYTPSNMPAVWAHSLGRQLPRRRIGGHLRTYKGKGLVSKARAQLDGRRAYLQSLVDEQVGGVRGRCGPSDGHDAVRGALHELVPEREGEK